MHFVLPEHVLDQLDGGSKEALLGFLAILLRIWTIVGELIVTAIAYAIDYRGAINIPGAKGRPPHARPGTNVPSSV